MTQKQKNFYEKVRLVQEIYRREKIHEGIGDKWIYDTYICKEFFISYITFRQYLGINVRRLFNQ